MALKLNEQYPGRFNNPSADYPQGSFKNRTTPTSEDGSYFEQAWANDQLAFFSSLLVAAGVSANGDVDKVGASQYYTALSSIISAAISGFNPPLPAGYFSGFAMANDGSAPNTTVSVGPGSARSSLDAVDIKLTGTLRGILQVSGAWAAGDNQNKLDTGAKANSTTYHVFGIRKTSDGTPDVLFSLSATAPTIPVGYSGFRRIGRIVTDGSGNIRQFKYRGKGRVDWVTPIIEAAVTSPAQGSSLLTLTGLVGAPAIVHLNGAIYGDGVVLRVVPSDVSDPTIGSGFSNYQGGVIGDIGSSTSDSGSGEFNVSTDSLGQVRVRYQVTSGNLNYKVVSFGFTEIL